MYEMRQVCEANLKILDNYEVSFHFSRFLDFVKNFWVCITLFNTELRQDYILWNLDILAMNDDNASSGGITLLSQFEGAIINLKILLSNIACI